jgi:dolichol-phosphate mannosyltransferase
MRQHNTKDRIRSWTRRVPAGGAARRFSVFGAVAVAGLGVQLALLGLFHRFLEMPYTLALGVSVLAAMTFNFLVHNVLTFGDRRLRGLAQIRGWLSFCLASGLGGVLNMGVATACYLAGWHWALSGLLGAAAGGLVNYALASRFTWKPGER